MDGRRDGGNSPWKKALIGFVLLVLAFTAYSQLAGGGEKPLDRPQTTRETPPPPPLPKRWHQDYETTFRYSGHTVTVRWVDVDRLHKTKTRVRYRLTIIPSKRDGSSWISDKRRYTLSVPDRHATARSVKITRSGRRHTVHVSFSWPRSFGYRGSRFMIQLPSGRRRPTLIQTALEIPRAHKGVEERSGGGRL